MVLFHGTSDESVKSIYKFGFNRSLCGKNGKNKIRCFKLNSKTLDWIIFTNDVIGTAYGQGVYFAVNSQYSDGYAGITAGSFKIMFRVRILAGESTVGNSSMREPPKKKNGEPYDSTTDAGKTIYVCYHDNQCYPEYIITYA